MPATDSPSARLDRAQARLEDAEIAEADRTAIREVSEDLDTKTTKETYIAKLCVLSESADAPLTELSPSELNGTINALDDARGWSASTKRIYQSAARKFIGQDGQEDSDIDSASPDRSPVDERDVYTPAEFHDIRESSSTARDQCIIDLLGFTGQRISVIQQLKVSDVDVEAGEWFMPDGEGLKGADEVMNKRPLLGALKSAGEWIEKHPTGEPDDYLITSYPSSSQGTPGEMLSAKAIRHAVRQAVERAGVDKPANPHNFRHYFVTVAKTRYDLDPETIKALVGHAPDSNVWKTTYAHLSDEDHIDAAERAFGIRDGEDDADTAPPICEACGRPLRPSETECPAVGCGRTYAFDDAEAELQELQQELDGMIDRYQTLKEQTGG